MSDSLHTFERHVASLLSDTMADTLYGDQEPHVHRTLMEMRILQKASECLRELYHQQESGEVSMEVISRKLARIDDWIYHRLSGQNMLALAQLIESQMADFVMYLPKFMGVRYEELRIARLWSALLNPESLERLTLSIRADSDIYELDDSYTGQEGGYD